MSTHAMDVTPQEGRLLRAFRLMDRDYKFMMVDLAEISADPKRASKPHLQLVASGKPGASDAEAPA